MSSRFLPGGVNRRRNPASEASLAQLRAAIWHGDRAAVEAYTGDINAADRHGHTPLRMALMPLRNPHARPAVLEAIAAKAGFKVDQPSHFFTAATWAAYDDRLTVDVLRWLVTVGADVNKCDELGSFPIHRALESGLKSGATSKIDYLLSLERLDVTARDAMGSLPIDVVVDSTRLCWLRSCCSVADGAVVPRARAIPDTSSRCSPSDCVSVVLADARLRESSPSRRDDPSNRSLDSASYGDAVTRFLGGDVGRALTDLQRRTAAAMRERAAKVTLRAACRTSALVSR